MDILNFKKANCRNCFKCLRECPVKAIAFKDDQAQILRDSCLICGHCLTVCPQNAKQVRSDVDAVKELIAGGRRVVASVAPAFIAAFRTSGLSSFERALQSLGFYAARETSEGAYAVAMEYQRLLRARQSPVLVSTACPTVVKLAEKYYPETIPYLAAVVSPMTAHAKMLKETWGGSCAVVFIGPCISKKDEAGWDEDAVDYVLTFDELQSWFDEAGVRPDTETPRQEPEDAAATKTARLFPVGGGILGSMPERLPDVSYVGVSGIDKCREVLTELSQGNLHGCFIELSACDGSCLGGPCMIKPPGGLIESIKMVSQYARLVPELAPQQPLTHAADAGLGRTFTAKPVLGQLPGENAIREILAKIGKKGPEDELNCGACGYSTCRQKAVAVYQGKAELGMCMPYMRERAEFISDNVIAFTPNAIIVLDNYLNIQAFNQAAVNMFDTGSIYQLKGRYIGELTDSSIFEEAVVRKQNILDRKACLYKNGKYVEQSVIYVKEHNLVFGIFKDLTETQQQSEKLEKVKIETVETADRVIEKQMRIAQEIAMLLGESTAETKIALTKLKETMVSKEG